MEKLWDRIKGAMDKSKDKMYEYTDWEKIKDTMTKGKDKLQEYTDKAVDKAEESAEVLKWKVKKMSIQRRIYKKMAKVGASVYESAKKGKNTIKDMPKVENMLNDTKKLDEELVKIMSILDDLSKS